MVNLTIHVKVNVKMLYKEATVHIHVVIIGQGNVTLNLFNDSLF